MNRPKPSVFRVGDRVALIGNARADAPAEIIRVFPKRVMLRRRHGDSTWTESLSKRQVRRLAAGKGAA